MAFSGPGLAVVFGGSGFVGTQVVRALAKRGWRVRVAVRRPHHAIDLKPMGDVGQVQIVRCDVRRDADVESALRGADAVINLVGKLYETPGAEFEVMHVEAPARIARAAAADGVSRFVQISAIGAAADAPGAYGRSKAAGEAAVRAAIPGAVILRPSIVFGAGDDFLNRFARMAQTAPALPLIGGGETRFQPIFVGDLAEAIARATTDQGVEGKIYELGGPAVWTFKDILRLILRETNREYRLLAPIPFRIAELIGSAAGLTTSFGIAPVLTRDQVLMLTRDTVVAGNALTLADLGVEPTGLEAIAPSYLWRYRAGGQFAERTPEAVEA